MEEIKGLCHRADVYLHSARVLIAEGDCNSAVSRAYYAMFYMTQACLLSKGIAASSHNGNAQKFSELFIKTGIFPKEFGRYLAYSMEKRSKGDYDIFSNIDQEIAQDLLDTAMLFKERLEAYLGENGYLG